MFSCEGSAIRFILNQFEVLSKRNMERARCNFVMNASGLVVSSWTLSGTHSAAIGLVVRSHLKGNFSTQSKQITERRDNQTSV